MFMIKKILLHLWVLWCLLVFAVLCILVFPVLVLAVLSHSARLMRAAHYVPPMAARVCLFLFGMSIEIRNKELIDADGQYIYISNHRSLLDAVIAGAVIPNYLKFLGKAEMLKWPVLGYLVDKFYVAVERGDEVARKQSMLLMQEKIKTGASFFICPEGTCNRGPELLTHFHSGAFRLSADTGVPLVPLTFIGSGERWPRSSYLIHPGPLLIYWHAAIPASEFAEDRFTEGKEKVINIIKEDLLKHYPAGKYEN